MRQDAFQIVKTASKPMPVGKQNVSKVAIPDMIHKEQLTMTNEFLNSEKFLSAEIALKPSPVSNCDIKDILGDSKKSARVES